jgi:hypothetical protein
MHLSDTDQDIVSQWLSKSNLNEDINIYVYNGETNISWLLHALGRCEYRYINLDSVNNITQSLMGYVLGKNGVCYQTSDENLASIYSHINSNRTNSVTEFLERALSA